VILWRLLPWDPDAHEEEPGGALWFPRNLQGGGRHDNPDSYGCLYVSERALSTVLEALAPFRGTGSLSPSMLTREGRALALVRLELTLDDDSELIDLDDPYTLTHLQLRPSEVATNNREVTQPQAEVLFERHPRAVALRWWSTLEASVLNFTLHERAALFLSVADIETVTLEHPAVTEAAGFLGLALLAERRISSREQFPALEPVPASVSTEPPGMLPQLSNREAIVMSERIAKVDRLRASGTEPYPHDFPGRTLIAAIHAAHDPAALGGGEHEELRYKIAGRLKAQRGHGKTLFLDIRDGSGQIPVVARLGLVGEELFRRAQEFDLGDVIGVEGFVYVTPRGQLALSLTAVTMLGKALRPPPVMRHGLEEVETRFRHRELDLMANEDTRELFRTRARTIAAIRDWMNAREFIEIETPVLQMLAGGANARPFITHHNALERDLSLTISGEFHLKRCVVGGLERVYMLDKCFRNEGISHKHSPEFTLLEWEMAYADYRDVYSFMEELVIGVARQVLGTTTIPQNEDETIELAGPWRRVTMREAIRERVGIDVDEASREQLAAALGNRVPAEARRGQLTAALYSKRVEPHISQPTIIYDFPVEFHPVVKRHRELPGMIEHFEMVIRGIKVGSGSSELNDPTEQRQRFVDQRNHRPMDEGDEPYPGDEEFVRAMEYGMPPLGGAGIGIDRLLAIFTACETLREVIAFPALQGPG
jgi:lysyl-tRNA synthetase class 2